MTRAEDKEEQEQALRHWRRAKARAAAQSNAKRILQARHKAEYDELYKAEVERLYKERGVE